MRRARHKSTESAFYHIITRVAGSLDFYPLMEPEARRKLNELIWLYVRVYCCILVSFEVMGNHYHLILWMRQYRPLPREELRERAFRLWGAKAALKTASWSDEAWDRFNRKLFDLSALMQHLNGEYAKWYNRRYHRHGHFWGDRFKNPELLDFGALQRCLLYIETNATRAKLVERPEQWEASSAWLRFQGRDEQLMPIERIFADVPAEQAFETYRERLEIRRRQDEEADGDDWLEQRQRFFCDGIAIGSADHVARFIGECRDKGLYRRRKHPIPQLGGQLFTAREQRSHARR
jgi:REP element-mobilizing transposase RayT